MEQKEEEVTHLCEAWQVMWQQVSGEALLTCVSDGGGGRGLDTATRVIVAVTELRGRHSWSVSGGGRRGSPSDGVRL